MAPVSDMEVKLEGKSRREGTLSREDCLCPVCLEIFMEPVTLPCTHTFCKGCFLESVDKATLCCPMCRKRVSTWARLNSRNKSLVNQQLWRQIQTCFPQQCQRRLSGHEDEDEDEDGSALVCVPRVSQPGELRQEYEDELSKLTEERRVLAEEERKASEELIQRMLAEEEQLLQEERRRREEDERLALLLSDQLNSPPIAPVKKKEVGQIEKFLCPRQSQSSTSSFLSNKENILLPERPPPKLDYYGAETDLHPESETDVHPDPETDVHPEPEEGLHLGSQLITHGEHSAKRKCSELEAAGGRSQEVLTKRGCRFPVSSSTSFSSISLEQGALPPRQIAEWELELQGRRQQEEDDRRLALLLQKELDQEEKLRATDRRKGSADAYLLRRGGKEEDSSSSTPSRSSRKTVRKPSTSSPSPSATNTTKTSSFSRGRKQTTLTEMFSSLNN